MLLNRENLLKKDELKIQRVDLGNDDFVFVRQMSGHERDMFERSLLKEVRDKKGNVTSYQQAIEDFRAKLVVNVICNEQGENLLDPKDYALLSKNMSAAKLEKLVTVAQELNKISEADTEEMIKNSVEVPTESSISESVVDSVTPIQTTGSVS